MRLTDKETRLIRYIRHYPEWVDTIETMSTARAITYDGDKVQTSPQDVMLQMAIQIEDYQERIDKVDKCLRNAFQEDGLVSIARRVFCYQERIDVTKYGYYSMRRMLAAELVKVFGDGSTGKEEIQND